MSTNQQKKTDPETQQPKPIIRLLKKLRKRGKRLWERLKELLQKLAEKVKLLLAKFLAFWKQLKLKDRIQKILRVSWQKLKKLRDRLRDKWRVIREKKLANRAKEKSAEKQLTEPDKEEPTKKEQPEPNEAETTGQITRKQYKLNKKEEAKKNKKPGHRIFPIWQRIIVVLVLSVVVLVIGLMIGYAVIGKGKPFEALDRDTWQHIIDIVKKKK